MADPRHLLGRAAESAAERWLVAAGWRVLARRSRPDGGGELDLVALDPDQILVGIEVRARRTPRSGTPAASIHPRHVGRLRRALAAFASEADLSHRGLRVDLVSAEPVDGARDAWRLSRLPGIG